MLNARIRKRYLHGRCAIGSIGPAVDLTYPVERLGAGPATLRDLVDGKPGFFEKLKAAKNPLIIVGMGALAREDGAAVLALARELVDKLGAVRDDWNGFAVLHTAAARVGGLDLGLVPGEGGRDVAGILAGCEKREIDVVYLLAADEIDTKRLGKAFVIYQGHHGDAGAHRADVILPGAAYTEKPGTYVNTEGRVQLALPRRLSAGRCPRGLGDPARAVGASGQDPAVRHARPGPRAAGRREQDIRRARASGSRRLGRLRQARRRSPMRRSSRRSPTST